VSVLVGALPTQNFIAHDNIRRGGANPWSVIGCDPS
jgi:hypothetical protein